MVNSDVATAARTSWGRSTRTLRLARHGCMHRTRQALLDGEEN